MSLNRRAFLQVSTAAVSMVVAEAAFVKIAYAEGAKGTLRVAIAKPAGNLDPQSHFAIWAIQDLMFEPLVRYGKGGKIEPCLATDWKVEDGGKTLRLTLRQGVKFQDGTAFDAESCKWNLERWMGKEQFSWMNCSKYFQSLEVVDPYNITLRFKEPVLALLQELTYTRPPRFLAQNPSAPTASSSLRWARVRGARSAPTTRKAFSNATTHTGAISQATNAWRPKSFPTLARALQPSAPGRST